jgi:hypothetical protein
MAMLILITAGCGKPQQQKGFVKYEMKSFEKSVGDTTGKHGGYAKVKLDYPEIKEAIDKSTFDIFTNYIKDQMFTALFKEGRYKTPEFFIESFLNEYNNAVRDNSAGMSATWFIERKIDITFLNDKFICFGFSEFSFLGGAHPNTNLFFSVFDLVSGRKLVPADFFVEGWEDKLTAIAEKNFRATRNLKADEDLSAAGFWFKDGKFILNSNFGLTKDGIVFYYNAYEVAPYAWGSTSVMIPYKDVHGLVKKDFLPEGK